MWVSKSKELKVPTAERGKTPLEIAELPAPVAAARGEPGTFNFGRKPEIRPAPGAEQVMASAFNAKPAPGPDQLWWRCCVGRRAAGRRAWTVEDVLIAVGAAGAAGGGAAAAIWAAGLPLNPGELYADLSEWPLGVRTREVAAVVALLGAAVGALVGGAAGGLLGQRLPFLADAVRFSHCTDWDSFPVDAFDVGDLGPEGRRELLVEDAALDSWVAEQFERRVAWLERFARSRLHKLSSIFEFVRAMPVEVVDGLLGKKKGGKRRHNSSVD